MDYARLLKEKGIRPSAHRVAVAASVLATDRHPSADQVLARVRRRFPMISRATVYNTLNTLVEKGLLRELILAEGRVVFDPNIKAHHHFIDESSGKIEDIPWEALEVKLVDRLPGIEIHEYQVVIRGRRR